jgi:hypothetical protein
MRPRPGSQGILLDAPRMQAVGTAHVEESFGASGHVCVHLPALLARRQDLTINPALEGAILGVHHVLGGCTIITPDRRPSSQRLHGKSAAPSSVLPRTPPVASRIRCIDRASASSACSDLPSRRGERQDQTPSGAVFGGSDNIAQLRSVCPVIVWRRPQHPTSGGAGLMSPRASRQRALTENAWRKFADDRNDEWCGREGSNLHSLSGTSS